jgi:hypothetical protein
MTAPPLPPSGTSDPLAAKIMAGDSARKAGPGPPPPDDPNLKTLWVNGIEERVTEAALRSAFVAFGGAGNVRMSIAKRCAFVEMLSRTGAEAAVAALHSTLAVCGVPLRLSWARPRANADQAAGGGGAGAGGGYASAPSAWGGVLGAAAPASSTDGAAASAGLTWGAGGSTTASEAAPAPASGTAPAAPSVSSASGAATWGAAAAAALAALGGGEGDEGAGAATRTGPARRVGSAARAAAEYPSQSETRGARK